MEPFEMRRNEKAVLNSRIYDIEESRLLLLELALYEPNITHCFNMLVNSCLTEDIEIIVGGKQLSPEFNRHINLHYHLFCVDAIKSMFIYGFVPWYPRKLCSGDVVPSVLPHGSFTWTVQAHDYDDWRYDRGQRRERKERQQNFLSDSRMRSRWSHLPVPRSDPESKQVRYVVRLTHTDLDPEDVFVFETTNADLNINCNSHIYATVPSPLAHILQDYKNLREAQKRRSYADAWNTTARIFTSCLPPNAINNEPTHSYLYYETGSDRSRLNQGRYFMQSRHRELENQIAQPSNHVPSLYNLPIHHRLEQLHALSPCEDLTFLLDKYKRDVCSLLGIPYEVAYGRSHSGAETSRHVDMNGRAFSNTVTRICHMLEELVKSVYCTIYCCDPATVVVAFKPMPRLDVSSIDDLVKLWEIGAVTPDVTAQLSEILLLADRTNLTGKKRKTTHKEEEYMTNLKRINEARQPPRVVEDKGNENEIGQQKSKSEKKNNNSNNASKD